MVSRAALQGVLAALAAMRDAGGYADDLRPGTWSSYKRVSPTTHRFTSAQARPGDLGAAARAAMRGALAALAGCELRAVALTGVQRLTAKVGPGGLLVTLAAALGADPTAGRLLAAQLRVSFPSLLM